MPKEAFTARWVQALKSTGERVEYFDETLTGLVLRIEPSGRKSWRVAFRANNRWRRMNIGAVSLMDLAKTRARAREVLGKVAGGHDPAAARQADRDAGTFAELASEYIEKHAKKQKRSWREDYRLLYGSPHKRKTGKRPHVPLVKCWDTHKVGTLPQGSVQASVVGWALRPGGCVPLPVVYFLGTRARCAS